MTHERDILKDLRKDREKAEREFDAAFNLKDALLIGHTMSLLNKIDHQIIAEERRQQEREVVKKYGIYNEKHPDWHSPANSYARMLSERLLCVSRETRENRNNF